MTILEWRSNPETVKLAAELLRNPTMQLMLDTLSSRAIVAAQPLGASPDDKATILGEAIGYRACLDSIRLMGILHVNREEPESKFEPE